jgi:hypothetical protein
VFLPAPISPASAGASNKDALSKAFVVRVKNLTWKWEQAE